MPAAIARLTSLALFTTSLLAAPALAEDAAPVTPPSTDAPAAAADATGDSNVDAPAEAADAPTDAAASPSTTSGYVPQDDAPNIPLAIAVNLPVSWFEGRALAGSLYAGVGAQGAIRLNVASYKHGPSLGGELMLALLEAEDEGSYSGRTTDIGVSYVHYSRRRWDGFMVEAGVLRRAKDHRTVSEFAPVPDQQTDTTTYAGRLMIGWSWLIDDWAFIAIGVGASMGVEKGTQINRDDYLMTSSTADIDRSAISAEGFIRIGGALGL